MSLESLVAKVADEFMARQKRGERPAIEDYAGRYPQAADVLGKVLAALELLNLSQSAPAEPGAPPSETMPGLLGDFRIVREIGRGGMGIVYEADQVSLGRRVALKVLPFAGALDSKQLQRFKNEAQAAAHLHHTNVVPVSYVGCDRGVHYYAMQLIEGQTLAQVIRELRHQGRAEPKANTGDEFVGAARPSGVGAGDAQVRADGSQFPGSGGGARDAGSIGLPAAQAEPARVGSTTDYAPSTAAVAGLTTEHSTKNPAFLRSVAKLGIQAAEALEHAHAMGVIHRDIKPGNLLVDQRGHLWVTDFGLAQFNAEANLTLTGDILGTLRYMSPEQSLAQRVVIDHRTDIYSLGVTLYELLTLEPAVGGRDRQEILRRIAFEEPKAPRRINKAIPAELETIVQKAAEKNPADRYATAQELADDLERFLRHEPIRARRPTVAHRLVKWSRRHADWVAAVAVVLLLAVVGTGVSALLIAGQRDAAREAANKARDAEEKAHREAAIAKAVTEFLQKDLLDQADISNQLRGTESNPNITVRELLDRAAQQIDTKFQGQELTEAAIRVTIGMAYRGLSLYPEAEKHLKRSLVLQQGKLGADDPDTFHGINELALLYLERGQYDEAEPLCKQVPEGSRAKLGPDHPDTLNRMHNLASLYEKRGRYDEAEALNKQALEARRAKLGPDHPDTLGTMTNLALVYADRGRYDEAEPLLKQALEAWRAKLGADHPGTLGTMTNLALVYADRGRYGEAEPLLLQAYEGMKQREDKVTAYLRGRDMPGAMERLVQLYDAWGNPEKAAGWRKELGRLVWPRPQSPSICLDSDSRRGRALLTR
jgi:serine/threonine protein kinase